METALSQEETNRLLEKLNDWTIREGRLTKEFEFKNFKEAIKFINEIAELSENENHHPEILLTNIKNVRISLKTYCINSLSRLDFLLASKIDKIPLP